jgi:hypothetical protein
MQWCFAGIWELDSAGLRHAKNKQLQRLEWRGLESDALEGTQNPSVGRRVYAREGAVLSELVSSWGVLQDFRENLQRYHSVSRERREKNQIQSQNQNQKLLTIRGRVEAKLETKESDAGWR